MTKQPSILKQVVMLAEYAKDVVLNGGGKTTPEEATRRWQICLACPLLVSDMPDRLGRVDGQKRCTDCGCSMGLKVGNQAAKCANKSSALRWGTPESDADPQWGFPKVLGQPAED